MKKFILIFCTVIGLSACSTTGNTGPYTCPEAGFMAEAGAAAFFAHPAASKKAGQTPDNVNVYAVLDHLKGECTAGKDAQTVDFTMDIVAQKTALGQGIEQQNLSYFIAVLDKEENVLQQQRFYVTVDFGKTDSGIQTVSHRINVPAAVAKGARVAVGFTLTPEQVTFNKAHPYDLDHQLAKH